MYEDGLVTSKWLSFRHSKNDEEEAEQNVKETLDINENKRRGSSSSSEKEESKNKNTDEL